jgi:hypothetical protein
MVSPKIKGLVAGFAASIVLFAAFYLAGAAWWSWISVAIGAIIASRFVEDKRSSVMLGLAIGVIIGLVALPLTYSSLLQQTVCSGGSLAPCYPQQQISRLYSTAFGPAPSVNNTNASALNESFTFSPSLAKAVILQIIGIALIPTLFFVIIGTGAGFLGYYIFRNKKKV